MEINQKNFSYEGSNGSKFGNDGFNQNIPDKPNNYLALSIVGTILGACSCIGLITGIIAIVMSSQSSKKYNEGDYQGSINSAKYAKILGWVSIGLFVASMINSYFNIQSLGGWDAFLEQFNDAIEAAEAAQ